MLYIRSPELTHFSDGINERANANIWPSYFQVNIPSNNARQNTIFYSLAKSLPFSWFWRNKDKSDAELFLGSVLFRKSEDY